MVADDYVLANVSIVTDFAVFADDSRAFNHRAIFDHRALADEHLLSNKSAPVATVVQSGPQMGRKIGLYLFEGVPGIVAPIENAGVFSLFEVKQLAGFEHAPSLCQFGSIIQSLRE